MPNLVHNASESDLRLLNIMKAVILAHLSIGLLNSDISDDTECAVNIKRCNGFYRWWVNFFFYCFSFFIGTQ